MCSCSYVVNLLCDLTSNEDKNAASQSSTVRQDSMELECVETDLDQQTAHSADALLRRDPRQLTRVTSSDHDDDLDFDATAADEDDDEEEEERGGDTDRARQ